MAENDFTFESEELLKKRGKRKYIIAAAILVGVGAIAALIITLVVTNRKNTITDGEDSGYPYTWKSNSDGSITLKLDKSTSPDYNWLLKEAPQLVTVAASSKVKSGYSEFSLSADVPCIEQLDFCLQRGDSTADRIREYSLIVTATQDEDNGKITLELAEAEIGKVQGNIAGPADENGKAAYTVSQYEDGIGLLVRIPDRYDAGDYVVPGVFDPETGIYYDNWREAVSLAAEEGRIIETADLLAAEEEYNKDNMEPRIHDDWYAVSSDPDIVSARVREDEIDEVAENPDAGISVILQPGMIPGIASVQIHSDYAGKDITVRVENTENGFTVVDHSLATFEAKEVPKTGAYSLEEGETVPYDPEASTETAEVTEEESAEAEEETEAESAEDTDSAAD